MFHETDTEKGYGVELEEYNGLFSLRKAQRGKDGEIYPMWCYLSQYEDGEKKISEKPTTLSVRLGNREEATEIITKCLKELTKGGDKDEADKIV
ncbi:MAG: hypothetical protein JRC60_00355 [Deltaproteobacteria bacterium]|nr:hypothetical protein [Deltaproteobacteria bacterium]